VAEEKELKYGVSDLAEAMGIEPASCRVWLRKRGIKKNGASYGWATKSEVEELVKKHADENAEGRAGNLDKARAAKKAVVAKKAPVKKTVAKKAPAKKAAA
jgi:hypothetical protein